MAVAGWLREEKEEKEEEEEEKEEKEEKEEERKTQRRSFCPGSTHTIPMPLPNNGMGQLNNINNCEPMLELKDVWSAWSILGFWSKYI